MTEEIKVIPTNGTSADDVKYAKRVKEVYIDGVNVAGCEFLRNCIIPDNYGCKIDDGLCCDVGNCYYKQLKRLEQENKDLKKQIELDKGLITVGGKQQHEYLQRIDELEQENEKHKEYIKDLQKRKDRYYLQVLEYERQVNDWISFYIKVRDIVVGNYEILDSQGLQDLRRIISEVEE